jgi:hypothetical protein
VTVIVDRSGSMEAIASDVIGGFNQFITDQKRQPGGCRLTLVQFDNQYEVVYLARSVGDASRLTKNTFEPRGSTALLDAIGRTIDTNRHTPGRAAGGGTAPPCPGRHHHGR